MACALPSARVVAPSAPAPSPRSCSRRSRKRPPPPDPLPRLEGGRRGARWSGEWLRSDGQLKLRRETAPIVICRAPPLPPERRERELGGGGPVHDGQERRSDDHSPGVHRVQE